MPDDRSQSSFSPTVWKKAQELVASGKIKAFASVESYHEADVLGSEGEVYRVKILLERGRMLSGSCACPSRRPCKHMAAVILRVTRPEGPTEADLP